MTGLIFWWLSVGLLALIIALVYCAKKEPRVKPLETLGDVVAALVLVAGGPCTLLGVLSVVITRG